MKGVICIGANLGQEIEGWLSLGVKHFMLFEPVMMTFQKLEKIVKNKSGKYISWRGQRLYTGVNV
jgi:hypothetical protein